MANIWDKLAKKAGKKWDSAKKMAAENGGGNPNVEDGRYIAQIKKFEAGTSAGGRDQVARDFVIIEGESKGEKLRDYQGLDTDKGISFFMRDLERLGYEKPDGMEDCGDIVDEINKEQPKVRITVKNSENFQNVYIDKALSADEVEDGGEEAEGVAAEEEIEIEVGMTVVATVDGKEVEGKVVKILEAAGKVKIEDEDGETYKVAVADVELKPEEKPAKGKKAEKDEEVDLEEMDRDELEKFVEENDLDIDVDSKKLKDDDDLREAIEEAMEDGGKKDDDDDDADEKPSKGKVTAKTGSLKKKK